ncbi:MAG: DUF362 domain-containing protein, partial [Phycisphaerae bacterium]
MPAEESSYEGPIPAKESPRFESLEKRVLLSGDGSLLYPCGTPVTDANGDGMVDESDMTYVAETQEPATYDSLTSADPETAADMTAVGDSSEWVPAGWFQPGDAVNDPVGQSAAIHPGRVAWVRDVNATDENWTLYDKDQTDYFWQDNHNDQGVIDRMMQNAVKWVAGEATTSGAWDALFRDLNVRRYGVSDRGYAAGDGVAIKANFNEARSHDDVDNSADLTPHTVLAMLKTLVYDAGVPAEDIYLFDTSRYISNKFYDKIMDFTDEQGNHPFAGVHMVETAFYSGGGGTDGREAAVQATGEDAKITYSGGSVEDSTDYVPQVVMDSRYVVNLALLKKHQDVGMTGVGKNHFGSLGHAPINLHSDLPNQGSSEYGNYRPMVDHLAHQHLGGKTVLYVTDGLWGGWRSGGVPKSTPTKWYTLGNDYPSMILASQDPVAIDSVALDFVRWEEYAVIAEEGTHHGGYEGIQAVADDFLHEAANAGNFDPTWTAKYGYSGVVYDPDGTPVSSLGVHEHWNNPFDRQYSRNLDSENGTGIELVSLAPAIPQAVDVSGVADGQGFEPGSDIALSADVTGPVTQVDFYDGSTLIGSDSDGSDGWGMTWSGAAYGTHTITARTDDGTTSAPVSITVAAPGDTDGDGYVNEADRDTLLGNYGASGVGWSGGDFDNDGDVDFRDAWEMLSNYNPAAPVEGAPVGSVSSEEQPQSATTDDASDGEHAWVDGAADRMATGDLVDATATTNDTDTGSIAEDTNTGGEQPPAAPVTRDEKSL